SLELEILEQLTAIQVLTPHLRKVGGSPPSPREHDSVDAWPQSSGGRCLGAVGLHSLQRREDRELHAQPIDVRESERLAAAVLEGRRESVHLDVVGERSARRDAADAALE